MLDSEKWKKMSFVAKRYILFRSSFSKDICNIVSYRDWDEVPNYVKVVITKIRLPEIIKKLYKF